MTPDQIDKFTDIAIQYATLRDAMARAAKVDDWARFDRAAQKFRDVADLLWDLGHELLENHR